MAELEKEREGHTKTSQSLIKSRNESELLAKSKEKYKHNFAKSEKMI